MADSESEITADLVRDLLREQHPDLAGLPIREVQGGWGNQMWRLGDELAVRMQRMDPTPERQLKERQWLPILGPRLPLPVPTPVRFGEPSGRFGKHWTIVTWVPGEPLDHGTISRGEHAADTLADFLRALHVPAPADAPASADHRGAHPSTCTAGLEERLAALAPHELAADELADEELAAGDLAAGDLAAGNRTVQAIRAVWDDAVAASAWDGPPMWVHGDLHPANVVVADGTLAGIVDFGEIFAGDPAWDLSAAWVLLPAGGAARFFEAYERADESAIRRARGLAALQCLFLILMGQAGDRGLPGGKPHWGPVGRAALERVLRGV